MRYIDGRGYHRIVQPQDPDFPRVFADAAEFELAKLLDAPQHEKIQLVRVFPLEDAPETEPVDQTIARWASQFGYSLLEKVMMLAWTNNINASTFPPTTRFRSMFAWLVPADRQPPDLRPDFASYGIKFWNLPENKS